MAGRFNNATMDALAPNLVSVWNYDPADDLTDKVGSNDLTNVGTVDAAGVNNRCRTFDGLTYLNADVAVDDVDVAKGAISLWYRMNDGATWSDNALHWMTEIWADDNNRIWITKSGGNVMSCRFEGNNIPRVRVIDVSGRSDTNWHNLLIAWDTSANFEIWEDGIAPSVPLGPLTPWVGSPTKYNIGASRSGGAGRWAGRVDEISLYAGGVVDLAYAQASWNGGAGRFFQLKPTVDSFTATPSDIVNGTDVVLRWRTTGATAAIIDQGVGVVAVDGSTIVNPLDTTLYTITVTGPGGTATSTALVTVGDGGQAADNMRRVLGRYRGRGTRR